jgi:secreted trypsin-like serine protease
VCCIISYKNLDNFKLLDSGGPLTCGGKLVGLSSFGVRCGYAPELPGVFADVFYYREWIIDNMSLAIVSRPSGFIALSVITIVKTFL